MPAPDWSRPQDVLVVGAGPTGLMLAYWLARQGVKALVLDPKPGTGHQSRALAVQARTMETYDMLGLTPAALAAGIQAKGITLWSHQHEVGHGLFGEMGEGVSPHPFVFIMGQDRTERMLNEALEAEGVEVAWGAGLVSFSQDDAGVTALVRDAAGAVHQVRTRYLAGCDGAKSPVRHGLELPFEGGTYAERFYVADLAARGPLREGEVSVCLDEDGFVLFFPMPGPQRFRAVGMVPKRLLGNSELGFDDVRSQCEANTGMRVSEVSWFSTYQVHHRVASRFQVGRAFLLGDAGHVHSPVGGQGMNTGLMDATNLGWKLAAVVKGEADERLLLSYERERMPFAKLLVATTDRLFSLVTSTNPVVGLLRAITLPLAGAIGTRIPLLRHELFGRVSQTRIRYDESPLSVGRAGGVAGGDRLPWVPADDGSSNYDVLTGLVPHFQVYGEPEEALAAYAASHPAWPLVRLPHTPRAETAGLVAGACYLVRPDGYVAYAAQRFEATAFEAYLRDAWGWQKA